MAEMKSYRIYFSNGKDMQVDADGHKITEKGNLELYIDTDDFFQRTILIVNANLWTIIDIAPASDEDVLID